MYCPRCGSPDQETTKFCRQCGLAMTPVASYVASGETGQLSPPPVYSPSTKLVFEGMTPGQRLALTIMAFVMAPAVFGVLTLVPGLDELAVFFCALSGVLVVPGIVWSIIRYKVQ